MRELAKRLEALERRTAVETEVTRFAITFVSPGPKSEPDMAESQDGRQIVRRAPGEDTEAFETRAMAEIDAVMVMFSREAAHA